MAPRTTSGSSSSRSSGPATSSSRASTSASACCCRSLGRDRRPTAASLINTIGPVWDGNEVWLLVAGGATFAAFPEWYATLFSGFYLPLLLILVALIVRGVAFEYRGKGDSAALAARLGRRASSSARCARAAVGRGVRATSCAACRSNAAARVHRHAARPCSTRTRLLGGLTTLTLFALHGAVLPRAQDDRRRSGSGPAALATSTGLAVIVLGGAVPVWTFLAHGAALDRSCRSLVAAVALVAALVAGARHREGWAFAGTGARDRRRRRDALRRAATRTSCRRAPTPPSA